MKILFMCFLLFLGANSWGAPSVYCLSPTHAVYIRPTSVLGAYQINIASAARVVQALTPLACIINAVNKQMTGISCGGVADPLKYSMEQKSGRFVLIQKNDLAQTPLVRDLLCSVVP